MEVGVMLGIIKRQRMKMKMRAGEGDYGEQKKRLEKDRTQFEVMMGLVQQKEQLTVLGQRYQTSLDHLVEKVEKEKRQFKLVLELVKLERMVNRSVERGFRRLVEWSWREENRKGGADEKTKVDCGMRLEYRRGAWKIGEIAEKRVKEAWVRLRKKADVVGNAGKGLGRIERGFKLRLLCLSFNLVKETSIQSILHQKAQTVQTLKKQLKEATSNPKTTPHPPRPELTALSQKQSRESREKDQTIKQLRKTLDDERKATETKVESLEDELNRLNFENLRFRNITHNHTIPLNESEDDLSLRILDELEPYNKTLEEQLSQKYLSQVIRLKQTLEIVKEAITSAIQTNKDLPLAHLQAILGLLSPT